MSFKIPNSASSVFSEAPGLGTSPTIPKVREDGTHDPDAIREVAQQFESIFLHQVFKTMRSTIPKEGLMNGGFGGEVFTDMLDQQYADIASKSQTMGLAEVIALQMGAPADKSAHQLRQPIAIRRLNAAQAYGAQQTAQEWIAPVKGQMTSPFGMRRLSRETHDSLHTGMDIAAAEGTPIQATRAGTVVFSGEQRGNGKTVIIDHGNEIQSLYAQASEVLVQAGQKVEAGATIARVGGAGQNAGPHLHFEVRQEGRAVDPAPLIGIKQE